jgi:hypothetical protein
LVSSIKVEINLNQIKYNQDDCKILENGFNQNYEVKTNLQHYPSAVGWDAIALLLVIHQALKPMTDTFLSQLGSDIYNWSKTKLIKVIDNKQDFDESRIYLEFTDINLKIYANNKEDYLFVLENIKPILIYIQTTNLTTREQEMGIDVSKIKDRIKSNKD